ncbi:MAG: Fic family protein [Clostridiales bacterium]|nr:Fic family protein [Clostridiales bacterium]
MNVEYARALAFWQSQNIRAAADLDLSLDHFRILFAYHSGKIENAQVDYHDTREIFENGKVLAFTGDPRTLFEQQNQKLCYAFLREKIAGREPLTLSLVLEVHAVLTAGTYDERRFVLRGERPGQLKKHDYVTGRHEAGSAPEDTEEELEVLLTELREADATRDLLLSAAYFHAAFENIHPFADGNGRVGRMLLNYFLMIHDHPPLIVFDEDKKAYYAALEAYDSGEDLEPLREFLEGQLVKTWGRRVAMSE